MAADHTVIVQLTDLHLGDVDERPYGTDTAENVRRVAAVVQGMNLDPDAVILTGDLSDRGTPQSYEVLRKLVGDVLEPLGAPVFAVVGNHDHRGTFRGVYLGEGDGDDAAPYYQAADVGGVRLLMCDSYLAGNVTGLLGDEQLQWIDAELREAGDRPCVIGLHHPSIPRGVPRANDYLLEDRAALREIILERKPVAVLCGHSHVSSTSTIGQTLHAAAPATAYLLDPSKRTGARAYRGSGFAICTVRDEGVIVNPYFLPSDGDDIYVH